MKKILRNALITVLVLLIGLGIAGYVDYRSVLNQMSLEDKIELIQADPDYTLIEDIHDYLLEATVSVEDQRFYTHSGMDPVAYLRLFYVLVTTGKIQGGGSTITQQLAKNLYFEFNPSIIRKIAEVFMAFHIESNYEKEEILEIYVNIINYGDNYIGIKEATQGYFHCDPSELSFDEATLLAGIPQSPANLQLSNNEKKARLRQQWVLQTMKDNQDYSEDEWAQLVSGIPFLEK